jgi:N-acetylmuramoyl-L-alanine amidase
MYEQEAGWFTKVNGHRVKKRAVGNRSSGWPARGHPIGVVFHFTVGCNADISATLVAREISCHFSVGLEGEIFQYVAALDRAWHADNANGLYWGIEHAAWPGRCELNDEQLDTSASLVAALVEFAHGRWTTDVPLRKVDGPDLDAGFHDHRDGDGDLWNFNGHTDHLYTWSWDKYLGRVSDVLGGEVEDVNLDEYIKGQEGYREKFRDLGDDPGPAPDDKPDYFRAGWTSERFGAQNPKTPHTPPIS